MYHWPAARRRCRAVDAGDGRPRATWARRERCRSSGVRRARREVRAARWRVGRRSASRLRRAASRLAPALPGGGLAVSPRRCASIPARTAVRRSRQAERLGGLEHRRHALDVTSGSISTFSKPRCASSRNHSVATGRDDVAVRRPGRSASTHNGRRGSVRAQHDECHGFSPRHVGAGRRGDRRGGGQPPAGESHRGRHGAGPACALAVGQADIGVTRQGPLMTAPRQRRFLGGLGSRLLGLALRQESLSTSMS